MVLINYLLVVAFIMSWLNVIDDIKDVIMAMKNETTLPTKKHRKHYFGLSVAYIITFLMLGVL